MKYENRNGICMVALATTLCLFTMAQPAFAVEWNPMDWGTSQSEKANARAKKAEQEAWEAQQRLEKAEKETQQQLERVKQEAAARKEAAETARKEATLRDEMSKKQRAVAEKRAKQEARRLQNQQEDSDREAAREAKQSHGKQTQVAQRQTQNHKSIWNPLSWFGGNETQQAQATPATTNRSNEQSGKAAATALLMQSSEGQEISDNTPGEESEQRLIARGKKETTVILPEGVKQEDARFYEEARKMRAASIETQRGNIVIELYPDVAPVTVTNFVKLTSTGFYNQLGMKFHRVVPGFVVQTGDPTGTGAGGSKERIPLEAKNRLSHDAKGVVAMARGAAPDSATSQFYITLAPQKMLDAKYAIFGRVIQGFNILEKIEKDDRLYGVKLVDERTITREDPNAASKQSLLKKIF